MGILGLESWDWQLTAALLCVVVAMTALARRAVQLMRNRSGGCGSCGGCPTNDASPAVGKQQPFVPIDSLRKPSGKNDG